MKDELNQENQENQENSETIADVEIEEVSLDDEKKDLEKENLRLRADMENLRKRAFKEKTDYARYANENLLGEIIPVCDNFERATQVSTKDPDMENFLKIWSISFLTSLGSIREGVPPPINIVLI